MINKNLIIDLKFNSFFKFSLNFSKKIDNLNKIQSFKNNYYFFKTIIFFWFLKKYSTNIKVNFIRLKRRKKIFTLLKSPRGFKKGKLNLSYQYYQFLIKITYNLLFNNFLKYFNFFLILFKNIDTSFYVNTSIKMNYFTKII